MSENGKQARKKMQDAIRQREVRRDTWKNEGERPLWKNLSMVGALGWLVVAPTLLGVFLGRWLDALLRSGVTFSGALTFAGACFGFYLVWRRMNEE